MRSFDIPPWYSSEPPPPYNDTIMFVYVIECGGFSKIGISKNVEARLKQFREGNPFPCTIAIKRRVLTSGAIYAERYLHDVFSDKRMHGEWFAVAAQEIRPFILNATKRANTAAKIRKRLCRAPGKNDPYRAQLKISTLTIVD
jgi:hypothetical protein